ESKFPWNNSWFRLGTSTRRKRHHGVDAPLDFSRGERSPAPEAVSNNPSPSGIKLSFRVPGCIIKQMIEEKTNVRRTVRNPGFHSRSLLLVGLTVLTPQFRGYDLGMV